MKEFFSPTSIAVIGASPEKNSVGNGIAVNLLKGGVFRSSYSKPFKGKVFFVNPNHKEILGRKAYASVADVDGRVDLAVVVVPARVVPQVMEECGRKKVGAVVIISAGFAEAHNNLLQDQVLEIARRYEMRVLGPNTLGLINPHSCMNASFGLTTPKPGSVAFITQSGAIADSVIDWAIEEKYAFSSIVSLGNSMDLDAADFVSYFADDEKTRVIACYLEGVKDGRKFMGALRKAREKKKPVLVLKGGRSTAGEKAVSSHTGSMAGGARVFEGALKQCNAIPVDSIEELFDFAIVLDENPLPKKNAFAVVSNAGGVAVLLTDYCERLGVNLVGFSEETLKRLDATGKMHEAYSRRNPLDLVGDALPDRYQAALDVLLEEDYVSGVIVAQTLQTMTDAVKDALVVASAKKHGKPLIAVFMGGKYSEKGLDVLRKNNVPHYSDPLKAVKAASVLCKVSEWR